MEKDVLIRIFIDVDFFPHQVWQSVIFVVKIMLPHLLSLRDELFTIVEAILLLSFNLISVISAS